MQPVQHTLIELSRAQLLPLPLPNNFHSHRSGQVRSGRIMDEVIITVQITGAAGYTDEVFDKSSYHVRPFSSSQVLLLLLLLPLLLPVSTST